MASYRYMSMEMDGVTDAPNYTMRPTHMDMDMHTLGLMYAPSDKLTWMLMANHLEKDMGMAMQMNGMTMSPMHSSGWGDLNASAMWKLSDWGEETLLPPSVWGSPLVQLMKKAQTALTQLPYGMQLGSGTWDINPRITYLGQTENYSWGAQISALFRTGDNDQDYQLGSVFNGTVWVARKISDNLSVSARITGQNVGGIDGDKDIMNSLMSTSTDPENYGGESLSASPRLQLPFLQRPPLRRRVPAPDRRKLPWHPNGARQHGCRRLAVCRVKLYPIFVVFPRGDHLFHPCGGCAEEQKWRSPRSYSKKLLFQTGHFPHRTDGNLLPSSLVKVVNP